MSSPQRDMITQQCVHVCVSVQVCARVFLHVCVHVCVRMCVHMPSCAGLLPPGIEVRLTVTQYGYMSLPSIF